MESSITIKPLTQKNLADTIQLVIAAAENVHAEIGPGFETQIYQRAMGLELESQDIPFHREVWIDLFYRNQRIGHKRIDFVIGDLLVIVKSQAAIDEMDEIQAHTFLRNAGCEAGLLINFGTSAMQIINIEK
jgi:GxxExxY protein